MYKATWLLIITISLLNNPLFSMKPLSRINDDIYTPTPLFTVKELNKIAGLKDTLPAGFYPLEQITLIHDKRLLNVGRWLLSKINASGHGGAFLHFLNEESNKNPQAIDLCISALIEPRTVYLINNAIPGSKSTTPGSKDDARYKIDVSPFFLALALNRSKEATILLEKLPQHALKVQNPQHKIPLYVALESECDDEIIKKIIDAMDPFDLSRPNSYQKEPALYLAIRKNRKDIFDYLMPKINAPYLEISDGLSRCLLDYIFKAPWCTQKIIEKIPYDALEEYRQTTVTSKSMHPLHKAIPLSCKPQNEKSLDLVALALTKKRYDIIEALEHRIKNKQDNSEQTPPDQEYNCPTQQALC